MNPESLAASIPCMVWQPSVFGDGWILCLFLRRINASIDIRQFTKNRNLIWHKDFGHLWAKDEEIRLLVPATIQRWKANELVRMDETRAPSISRKMLRLAHVFET